jgi:hypothetical protein
MGETKNQQEYIVSRIFIYNNQLLRGSLSIKSEVVRREELVGMFSMSFSASRRGGQHVDGRRTIPAPVSAELQIGRERCRGFNLVCRGWLGEKGSEEFLIGGDGGVVNV